jgi:hypothetical protein
LPASVDRLTSEDVRILGLETQRVAGHTLKVTVLDAQAPPLGLAELRAHVAGRLGGLPRLAERLAAAPDGDGLAWLPDAGFDPDRHVREAPGGGTLEQAVARLMEERLDRDRPLWSLDLVDGRALVLKVHHALADGMAVRRIATTLLWDVEPEAHEPAHPAHGLADVPRLSAAIERELAPSVARSSLARRVSGARVVAFASAPLAGLVALRDAFGVRATVNDLVLAATAGGLRRWLLTHDAPLRRMRVKVPVSLHRPGEPALGNDDSFFFVDLPLDEPDPVARLRAIAAQCTARKRDGDALALGTLLHCAAALSPVASRAVVHWSMSPHVFTLNVSNVPGPRGGIRALGRDVAAVYALAEVADWHALRVAVFSAAGVLTFGLCGDREHVTGAAVIARGIEDELAALRAAAVS